MHRSTATRVPRMIVGAAALLAIATSLDGARADDYFRGDGTTYTLGETSAGNCNMMAANSDAGDNYAALNDVQWNGLKNCGRCALVSCDDARCADKSASQVVQILDRCPECKHGDLDLSPSVFKKLTNSDPSRYKIKWKFVDCPVQGGVQFCLKGGSNSFWTAIQPTNVVTGVANLKVNGQATTMVDSAYYYLLNGNSQAQTDLSAVKVTLTSVSGETMSDTVSLSAGACTSSKIQFARGGGSNGAPTVQSDSISEPMTPPATAGATPSLSLSAPASPPTTQASLSAPPAASAAPAAATSSGSLLLPAATARQPVPNLVVAVAPPAVIDVNNNQAQSPAASIVAVPAAATTPLNAVPVSVAPRPSVHRCRVKKARS